MVAYYWTIQIICSYILIITKILFVSILFLIKYFSENQKFDLSVLGPNKKYLVFTVKKMGDFNRFKILF